MFLYKILIGKLFFFNNNIVLRHINYFGCFVVNFISYPAVTQRVNKLCGLIINKRLVAVIKND